MRERRTSCRATSGVPTSPLPSTSPARREPRDSGPPSTQGKGSCKAGIETCTAGVWGTCQGETLPQPEVCDGADNNCDGQTDEGLAQECPYSGPAVTLNVGLCRAGIRGCTNGAWGACSGEVKPATETCDKKDNDCDGATDEGFTIKCESLACTGSGKIKTISNTCVDSDGGSSGSSDELEVYCCDGIARFCLSKETCPWRSGCGTAGDATCSHAGLSTDFMAHVACSAWNGHASYYCTSAGQAYFTP